MNRRRRRGRGITLIELGVAVGIVAILAAIAIPSLSWMIGRARANEAVDALGNIYTLEQAYHFENKSYGSLSQIGYVPEGSNRYALCAGPWSRDCIASQTDTFDFIQAWHPILRSGNGTPPPGPTPVGNPHQGIDTFEADAYGHVSNQPPPNDVDAWLIDENQQLVHLRVGY